MFQVTIHDAGNLFAVASPPACLWVQASDEPSARKTLACLPDQGLAIVGARSASVRNRREIERILRTISKPLVILSGLARGIDAEAHESALKLGLPTIAVLAHGVDQVYPPEHASLTSRIVSAGGILISEFAPGVQARKHHFLQRNRLIAGWARATWIVQARERSGALNTAKWAREQNRAVFATPCYPNDIEMAGNQILLDRDHAIALWDTHNLGAEWLELATVQSPAKAAISGAIPSKLAERIFKCVMRDGQLAIETAMSWALEDGLSSADFFEEIETMRSQRWITVGPDHLTRTA